MSAAFWRILVAHNDKFLAPDNKPLPVDGRIKRLLNQEPERVPMELTTGKPARKSDQMAMEAAKTIAIIDDDNGIRQSLKEMLSTAGFRVMLYASAEEFLAALGEARPDARWWTSISAACPASNWPPSGYGRGRSSRHLHQRHDFRDRAPAPAMGGVEFLSKPFMPIELLGAIFRCAGIADTF